MLCGTARVRLILLSQGSDTRAGWWAWCVPIVHPLAWDYFPFMSLSGCCNCWSGISSYLFLFWSALRKFCSKNWLRKNSIVLLNRFSILNPILPADRSGKCKVTSLFLVLLVLQRQKLLFVLTHSDTLPKFNMTSLFHMFSGLKCVLKIRCDSHACSQTFMLCRAEVGTGASGCAHLQSWANSGSCSSGLASFTAFYPRDRHVLQPAGGCQCRYQSISSCSH